jgi:hypothetical protein
MLTGRGCVDVKKRAIYHERRAAEGGNCVECTGVELRNEWRC